MLRKVLFIFIYSFLVGCTQDKVSNSKTHLGGEIINPVNRFLILTQKGKTIDTIYLNKNNRFSYTFKTDTLGLFNFRHRERQLVYLEKGDSVLIRVNTIEFDESLSFSGKGSERSNFLSEMFLLGEIEDEGFTKHFQKNPTDFQNFLDSIQNIRNTHYSRFLNKHNVSKGFQEIAEAATTFVNYQRKESYPFSHYVKNKLSFIKKLPDDFYSFRESININNPNLSDLYTYSRYLERFIDNQAFMYYGETESYNTVSYAHISNEIKVIEKYIVNKEIKDNRLFEAGHIFLANNNDKKSAEQIFTSLHQNITNTNIKNRLEQLYADYKKMEPGNKIPDLLLIKPSPERKVTLTSRLHGLSVIYFWSYNNQMHMENSRKKVHELSSKYPEFNFIGINLNQKGKLWQRQLDKHPHNLNNEYRFDNFKEARRKLAINDLSKTIIVNKNGVILNSHTNLHKATFEEELLAYLSQ